MKIDPIIPIWLMFVICIGMLLLKRRGVIPYLRQIAIVILLFVINLRIMVPSDQVEQSVQHIDANVLFVVDDTISMVARDHNGDTERLTGVKEDCAAIIDSFSGARFSVISYNNDAHVLAPFTADTEFAKSMVQSITPLNELYAKGSSMNICKDLLCSEVERAKEQESGAVIVFFFSDGEITNGDTLESFAEAGKYIDAGAVLGYGTEAGGKMYMEEYTDSDNSTVTVLQDTSDYPYKDAVSKLDSDNLQKIANDLEVSFINRTEQDSLDGVCEDIKKNVKISNSTSNDKGYTETYYWFVVPLLLLLLYECIGYKRSA